MASWALASKAPTSLHSSGTAGRVTGATNGGGLFISTKGPTLGPGVSLSDICSSDVFPDDSLEDAGVFFEATDVVRAVTRFFFFGLAGPFPFVEGGLILFAEAVNSVERDLAIPSSRLAL